jgi:hypothetical protein
MYLQHLVTINLINSLMDTQLLNKITLNYNLEISINKSKVMAFKGKYPVRSKIMINNKIIKQVKNFNYLGCDIVQLR